MNFCPGKWISVRASWFWSYSPGLASGIKILVKRLVTSYLSFPSIPPNPKLELLMKDLWTLDTSLPRIPPPQPGTAHGKVLGLWIWAYPESPSPNKNWNFPWSIMWGELVCGDQSLYLRRIPSRLFSLVATRSKCTLFRLLFLYLKKLKGKYHAFSLFSDNDVVMEPWNS